MYTGSSEEFNSKISSLSRSFSAKAVLSNSVKSITLTSEIKRISYSGGSCAADTLTIGSVISASVEIEAESKNITISPLNGVNVKLSIGVTLDGGSIEYIPFGSYIITSAEKMNNDTVKISACDAMITAEKLYTSNLRYPATALQMIDEICSNIGITRATTNIGNTVKVSSPPKGYTCREMLAYLSALYGKFAVINRNGKLEIRWYQDNGAIADLDHCSQPSISDSEFTLGYVKAVVSNDKTLSVGEGETGIVVSNPFMTQEALNSAWNDMLKDFTYTGAEVNIMLADPRVDPWDLISVEIESGKYVKVPCMNYTVNFDGGLSAVLTAGMQTKAEAEIDYKGPSITEKERIYAELMAVNQLLVNKADIDDLNANYITAKEIAANYATIQSLFATEAEIEKLKANLITTDYLDANYASIANLDAVNAKFNTYDSIFGFTEDSQIINLTAANVTIDDQVVFDMIAKRITVADLLTARAQAEKFDIITDGMASVSFKGATQQFYDSNGNVRVQIGQAKNGDFNFLIIGSDGKTTLFDENGITENAIADGLIVDDMVAENANIQGGKIDMQSLFENMNNSAYTLTSSKVLYDDSGQTLQVAFNKLTTDVRTIATNAENAAQSVVDRANSGEFKGDKGDKGDPGATGNGIKSVTRYYLATSASSGVTTSTKGWTTSLQFPSTDKRYLWIYDITEYTNGNVVTSSPGVFGVYGATGAKGDKGDAGAQGPKGDTGSPGAQGPKGEKGDTGTAGAKGTDGVSVSGVEVLYYLSTSSATQAGGSWSTTVPTWADGKYMWTKTRTIFSNSTALETDPVCITGAKGATGATGAQGPQGIQGEKGAKGDTGAQGPQGIQGEKGAKGDTGAQGPKGATGTAGVGIKSIDEHYAVSTSNTNAPESWSSTVPTLTATNKYLWNYETITYTNSTTADTQKRVIGVYGDKGATGAAGAQGPKGDKGATGATGATGNGIKTIVNYYLATASSSGVTTSTSGWTTTVQSVSASKKYLWNYEIVTYTNGSTNATTPTIIGAYGDKGAQGDKGDTGAKGDKGDTGKGVKSIVPQYYLSTSSTTQTGGNWSNTCPKWESGKYIWTRNAVTWTDNTTEYTTAVLANDINSIAEIVTDQGTTLTQLNGQIIGKVWQSDISTAVNGAVVEMNSKYSTVEQNLSDITMTVSSMEEDLDTTSASVSKLTQDLTGFKTTVSNTYTKKTDFDDIKERMSSAESSIIQHADEIALKVNKNGIISAINQTAESVKINASRINLSGYVTVSAYDADIEDVYNTYDSFYTEMDNRINNVGSLASSAMTAANSAKSTADAAYSWTNTNGTNMTNLRNMVLKWTNNAVSTTTRIQGGWIATNTITADKIAVGLSPNLMLYGFDDFSGSTVVGRLIKMTDCVNGDIHFDGSNKMRGLVALRFTTSSTLTSSNSCYYSLYLANDDINCCMMPVTPGKYYILSFYVKQSASSSIKIRARILSRSAPNANSSTTTNIVYGTQKTMTVGTSWVRYTSGPIKLPNEWAQISVDLTGTSGAHTLYFDCFQLEETTSTSSTVEASEWKPQGATIIDGGNILANSITAGSIAANAITADKIAAKTITADKLNVTALESISAKIGGFSIKNGEILAEYRNGLVLQQNGIGVLYNSTRVKGFSFFLGGGNLSSTARSDLWINGNSQFYVLRCMDSQLGVGESTATTAFRINGYYPCQANSTLYPVEFEVKTKFTAGLVGTVTSSSDERVKTDIRPISDKYITLFDNIDWVSYRYTDASGEDTTRLHTGITAQNLLKAISVAGLTVNDVAAFEDIHENGTLYGVNYTELIAVLAIKIKQLEAEIKEMKGA